MNPSEKYLEIRERCMKANRTVPNSLLRAHCDFMRKVLRYRTGLYPMVITIGQHTAFPIDMFPALDRQDIIIRVSGQHYGPNRI